MRKLIFLAAAMVACPAWAQVTVTTEAVTVIQGANGAKVVGPTIVVPDGAKLKLASAVFIRVETAADNIDLSVTNIKREPVNYETLSKGVYALSKPGKYWVEVTAIDFAKNIYGKKTTVVDVKSGGGSLGGVDIPEPSRELQVLVEPIRAKLATDPEKAAKVASVFYGFSKVFAGETGKKVNSVGLFGRLNSAALTDLDMGGGAKIGTELNLLVQSYVGVTKMDDGVEDKPLTDDDRRKIAELFSAVAWAGVQ